MNRRERRRATVLERRSEPIGNMKGSLCAWEGCQESFEGAMPEGWRWLLLYWAPKPVLEVLKIPGKDWDRDAALCLEHARALDGQLKDLARWTDAPAAGKA